MAELVQRAIQLTDRGYQPRTSLDISLRPLGSQFLPTLLLELLCKKDYFQASLIESGAECVKLQSA